MRIALVNRAPPAPDSCDLDNRQKTASSASPSERMPLGSDAAGHLLAGSHEVAGCVLPGTAAAEPPHGRPVPRPPSRWRAHTARQTRVVNRVAPQGSYAGNPLTPAHQNTNLQQSAAHRKSTTGPRGRQASGRRRPVVPGRGMVGREPVPAVTARSSHPVSGSGTGRRVRVAPADRHPRHTFAAPIRAWSSR